MDVSVSSIFENVCFTSLFGKKEDLHSQLIMIGYLLTPAFIIKAVLNLAIIVLVFVILDQIFNTKLENVKFPHSLLQQNEEDESKLLPSKDVDNKNSDGYLDETGTLENQKNYGKEDKDLQFKRTHTWNPNRCYFNTELVSNQPKERMRRRTFTSEIKDISKSIGSFMCVLFENQMFTDVNFFSKGSKTFLSAHRVVLAAKCEYFKDLLFGDLANESDSMQMDVEISNVPFCIFSNIIKWLYTGFIEFSNNHTAMEIYQAAKLYKVQQLIDECQNYIEEMQINDHNVCSNLQLCNTIQLNKLKRRCFKYIEHNTLSVINTKEFEKSSFNIVREICQLPCLSLTSEVDLLEAVLRWLNAQTKLKKNAVKELERALLKCIRFLSFSAKEFSDVISKNATLFTTEESLNILLNLTNHEPNKPNNGLDSLPKWCSRSQRILLCNQEKKDAGIEKWRRIQQILSEDSAVGKIKIALKTLDTVQYFSELTSVLHMRCKSGIHRITAVKFSFQNVERSRCIIAYLKIIVSVLPNGPQFLTTYFIKQNEITFYFPRAIAVHEGQVLIMEVTANANHSCKFLQFDKWFNDPKGYFDCFFISKPTTGKLYFISEVTYEPLALRLNFPQWQYLPWIE